MSDLMQAPGSEAITVEAGEPTTQDLEAIARMNKAEDGVEPPLVDTNRYKQSGMPDQGPHIVAQATADQAREIIAGTVPGSDLERQNLIAMREARRAGSMTVDGLQSAPQPIDPENTVDHPTPEANLSDEPVVEVTPVSTVPEKKRGFLGGLLDKVRGKE